jgi:hypothetical protein
MSFTKLLNIGGMFSLGIFTSYCMSDKNFNRFSTLVLPSDDDESIKPIDFVKGSIVLPSLLPFMVFVDE